MKYLIITLTTLSLVIILMSAMALTSSMMTNKHLEKSSPFECGFLGYEESRSPFSVHFFLVALIFLVFDIELVLMFPFMPMLSHSVSLSSYIWILGFMLFLLGGLVVEWEKSMLEWQT